MNQTMLQGRLAIFRINYKSDFIITLNSDAGWMTPFCIKFWTGAPSQAYFAGWDGTTYTNCAPVAGEPTKLQVQFDDHHLPIGELKYQIGYHFTIADFPTTVEDEVLNQERIVISHDGQDEKVLLDFNGETAPDIQFSLPAYANEAQRIANEQQRIANEQQRIANEEQRIANEQTRQQNEEQRIAQETARVHEFARLKRESESATSDATAAATLANTKAQLAADKAALAQSAADLANAKALLAEYKAALAASAAQLANDKAALAQQKAEYAQTQGTYAKNQGDYAKQQGNYAKDQGDTALADHLRAEADHETAASDHTRAESDHSTASSDHTQASTDHSTATSDHSTAAADHTQAGNDHTRAESDHSTAASDHTTAGNDHTRAESDHTRAESDHAAVEVYVDSLGAYDISAAHAVGGVLATYANLAAALGTNGANIPEGIRKGGMSVKFIQGSTPSSDNKYIQARCMPQNFTTDITQWQVVSKELVINGKNIIESGAVKPLDIDINGYNKSYDKNDLLTYAKWDTSGDVVVETEINYVSCQQIIDVVPGLTMTIYGYAAYKYRLWAFVDDDGNILSKAAGGADKRETPAIENVPNNATKLIVSSYNNYIDDFQLTLEKKAIKEKIAEIESGLSTTVKFSSQSLTNEQKTQARTNIGAASINDVTTLNEEVNGFTKNYEGWTIYGTYKTNGTVVEEDTVNYNHVQRIIDVVPDVVATIYGYGGSAYRLWAFVDSEGNILSKSNAEQNKTTTPAVVTAPAGSAKLYVSSYYNFRDSISVSIKKKSIDERLDDIEANVGQLLPQVEILAGKKAYFVGDSIMNGRPSDLSVLNITEHIRNDYGCDCHNLANNGSLFMYPWYTGNAYSIYYQLTQIPQTADYIIIQGGANGMNMTDDTKPNYAPMGNISSVFNTDFDKATQIGCLEAICKYLYENFAGKKYGFIMTYEIGNYTYWKEKAPAFMQVLEKWSIPVLDWRKSGISLASSILQEKYGIDTFANYPAYDENESYGVDDIVIYSGSSYKANEAISAPAGAFDSSKWTLVSSDRYDDWHCNGLAYKLLAHKTAEWMKAL